MNRSVGTHVLGWVFAVAAVAPLAAESERGRAEAEAATPAAVEERSADEMSAWSVDSGGGSSSGGDLSLVAAIGQPDAGRISKGGTVLAGGLWAGAVDLQALFYDGFESSDTGAWSSVVGGTE